MCFTVHVTATVLVNWATGARGGVRGNGELENWCTVYLEGCRTDGTENCRTV